MSNKLNMNIVMSLGFYDYTCAQLFRLTLWKVNINCSTLTIGMYINIHIASFPGLARLSLAVRNSHRRPWLVHHMIYAAEYDVDTMYVGTCISTLFVLVSV